ncbi:hypothetical protein HGRIS_005033 [Hohenbuehelia grisea]|uniref:F-box domain-containing protein n=1 Tax=Hohenbuehelia grisea TaxID=104357 RepID=A0ABR3JEQ2_9AGAR
MANNRLKRLLLRLIRLRLRRKSRKQKLSVVPPPEDPSDWTEEAELIDAPTLSGDAVSESIQSRRLRNRSTAISSLPAEILMEIFVLASVEDTSQFSTRTPSNSVTQVCHYWRVVAISFACLWRTIIPTRPKSVALAMARAGDHPLELRVCHPTSPAVEFSQNHAARINELTIGLYETELEGFIAQNAQMYSLEALSAYNMRQQSSAGCWLSDKALREQPKALRRLYLDRCAFAWDSPIYSSLTHLTLSRISSVQRPSLTALFTLLFPMVHLQHLSILDADPSDTTASTTALPNLPSLRSISLRGCRATCIDILNGLTFPSTASIDVCSIMSGGSSWSTWITYSGTYLLRAVAVHCKAGPTLTSMQLVNEAGGMMLRVGTSGTKQATIRIPYASFTWTPITMCALINISLLAYPLRHITHLELSGVTFYDSGSESLLLSNRKATWQYLEDLLHLRVLKLRTTNPMLLLETLFERAMHCVGVCMEPSTKHMHRSGYQSQLLPALTTIHLSEFTCLTKTMPQPFFMDVLAAFLSARQLGNAPLSRVILTECTNLRPSDLARIQAATTVQWDGLGQQMDSDHDAAFGTFGFPFTLKTFVLLAKRFKPTPTDEADS